MEERKISDYIILSKDTAVLLEQPVLYKIQKGYEPLGGVSAVYSQFDNYSGSVCFFTQAMIKYEEKKTTKKNHLQLLI